MPGAGRLGDKSLVPVDAHGCPADPHAAIGPAISGSSTVLVNGRPVLRVGDKGVHAACCGPNQWIARNGSASVFVDGRPVHRLGDDDQHCGGMGVLVEGSSDVIIGGPKSGSGGFPGICTPFGDYEIIPPGFVAQGSNQITAAELDALSAAWRSLEDGTGGIQMNGSDADKKAFLAMVGEEMANSPSFRQDIVRITGDTDHPIMLELGRSQPGTVVDSFATNAVDLDDLEQLPARPPDGHPNATTRGEMIDHFLVERYYDANHGAGFDDAHQAGIDAQNALREEKGQSPVTDQVFAGTDADGNIIGRTEYSDGTHQDVHIDSDGNIVGVDYP